jgi:hypothetical protein
MEKLANILDGNWRGPVSQSKATGPGRENATGHEIWRVTPEGPLLVEENWTTTANGAAYDYAAVWWNQKAEKYDGVWCAPNNDEACNGFDVTLEGTNVIMSGAWEHRGKRRLWREVYSHPNPASLLQELWRSLQNR